MIIGLSSSVWADDIAYKLSTLYLSNLQHLVEQAIVESLDMRYINLPIAGASGVTNENAQKLDVI
jgi:hypothetical protein